MKKRTKKLVSKKAAKTAKEITAKKTAIVNKSGILPLNDRVLVKPIEAEELNKTASGIIIPETVSKEKPEQGKVIAVGDGKWLEGRKVPLAVKAGDKVVFSRYGYDEVKIGGVEYYILKEENILAILKN